MLGLVRAMSDEFNPDDEYVEDDFEDGFLIMTEEEFQEWCTGVPDEEYNGN
jgi:hypothetical protein